MKKVYILSALLSLATCFTAKADNGKALEVYTVFGKLAGKAVAKAARLPSTLHRSPTVCMSSRLKVKL